MSDSHSSSYFSLVVVLALAAGGSVYAVKHRDEFGKIAALAVGHAAEQTGIDLKGMKDKLQAPKKAAAESAPVEHGDVELKANPSGHFEAEFEVNGSSIDAMVDTGATLVALTYEDAERAGIYLKTSDFTHEVRTANGVAKVAPVEIASISIGDITVRNIKGAVTERGKLHKTLLGMSFLQRLSRVEMRSNALVLHE